MYLLVMDPFIITSTSQNSYFLILIEKLLQLSLNKTSQLFSYLITLDRVQRPCSVPSSSPSGEEEPFNPYPHKQCLGTRTPLQLCTPNHLPPETMVTLLLSPLLKYYRVIYYNHSFKQIMSSYSFIPYVLTRLVHTQSELWDSPILSESPFFDIFQVKSKYISSEKTTYFKWFTPYTTKSCVTYRDLHKMCIRSVGQPTLRQLD